MIAVVNSGQSFLYILNASCTRLSYGPSNRSLRILSFAIVGQETLSFYIVSIATAFVIVYISGLFAVALALDCTYHSYSLCTLYIQVPLVQAQNNPIHPLAIRSLALPTRTQSGPGHQNY